MSEGNNIIADNVKLSAENTSETYSRIRTSVIAAQGKYILLSIPQWYRHIQFGTQCVPN